MSEVTPHDIEALIRTFDDWTWDELRVVVDGLEIYLSKNPADHRGMVPAARAGTAPAPATPLPAERAPTTAATVKHAAAAIPDGLAAVRAPNLGTFYRAPKPGAPPYVSIGEAVEPDTEICLIEVMKLFTPVRAGVAGIIRQVLAEDAQLVEFDQPLFLIEPAT